MIKNKYDIRVVFILNKKKIHRNFNDYVCSWDLFPFLDFIDEDSVP